MGLLPKWEANLLPCKFNVTILHYLVTRLAKTANASIQSLFTFDANYIFYSAGLWKHRRWPSPNFLDLRKPTQVSNVRFVDREYMLNRHKVTSEMLLSLSGTEKVINPPQLLSYSKSPEKCIQYLQLDMFAELSTMSWLEVEPHSLHLYDKAYLNTLIHKDHFLR